jgi:hypothetical protein
MCKINIQDQTFEINNVQFLEYIQRISWSIRDLTEMTIRNHVACLADFNGTTDRREFNQIIGQSKFIERQIKDPELKDSFHTLSTIALKVAEIDERIVVAYSKALHFDISTDARRKRFKGKMRKFLFSTPEHGANIPEEVFNLSKESLAYLPKINEVKKQVDKIIATTLNRA